MSMIQVSHLTFCYEGGMEPVFEDVSFRIDTDWKLGLTGRNGRGKTTLLKLLMGAYEYTGSIQGDVQMEYFPVPVKDGSRDVIEVLEEADPSCELWKICRELTCLGHVLHPVRRPRSCERTALPRVQGLRLA